MTATRGLKRISRGYCDDLLKKGLSLFPTGLRYNFQQALYLRIKEAFRGTLSGPLATFDFPSIDGVALTFLSIVAAREMNWE